MQKLGDLLKATREEKEISIKEASSSTKIREKMIEALESGAYDSFTSDTHLKSFIRAYSKYLGLNEDKTLAMYRRERQISYNSEGEIRKKTSKNYPLSNFISFVFNLKTLLGLIFLIILVVTLYFFYSQWQTFNQPPSLVIIKPNQNDTLEQENFVIEGITDSLSVKVVVDGNDANFVDSKGRFRVNAKFTEPGNKRFTLIAENEFKKRTEFNLDLIYKPKEVKITKQKIKVVNNAVTTMSFTYAKDTKTTFETAQIKSKEFIEIEYDSKLDIKNFDYTNLSLYLDEDINPIKSLDSKEFSIIIENSRPLIKIKQQT